MIKLSIIVPIYNVELYLENCLRSCAIQNIKPDSYEIILINDGSTDNSLRIAEDIAIEYENMVIYSQENRGLSAARNKGLSVARGEYVWFVDSDDWIADECLFEITEDCILNGVDILAFSAADVKGESNIKRFNYDFFEIIDGRQALIRDLFKVNVPFTIYRREFLLNSNLQFFVGIYHEDFEFQPRAFYFANRILFSDKVNYYVRQNPASITRTPNSKKAFDYIDIAKSLSDFSKTNQVKSLGRKFSYFVAMNINNSLSNSFGMDIQKRIELSKYLYKHRELFSHLTGSGVFKYLFEGIMFRLFPKKTLEIYQFLQKFNK